MADGFGNDAFQWKNSAHRAASLGIGGSLSRTDDDTDRNTDTLQKQFQDDMLEKLRKLVCMYFDEFDTKITIENRETIREAACCFWDYVKDKLYGDLKSQFKAVIDDKRRELEEELCSKTATLNSIGGTTRSCFAQTIIGRTLSDNSIGLASLESQLTLDAKKLEMASWEAAFNAKYRAFIEGDNADFAKYMQAFQILRGACFTEEVDDNIERDVTTAKGTFQYNRSAGDISDTTGVYGADYGDILASGGGLNYL